MDWLEDLCSAIATMEGFFKPGSLAQVNNNPGNLRPWWPADQTSDIAKKRGLGDTNTPSGRFIVGIKLSNGIGALYCDVMLKIAEGVTLRQLLERWAPPSDGNNTQLYVSFVSQRTGIQPDQVLRDLLKVRRV